MIEYKGKAKCNCGKRAKWKAANGFGQGMFACHKHKERLVKFSDPRPDDELLTEADYQTWAGGLKND